jgi:predicted oxidoreductase (fatty acid repression mutant protein)
MKCRNSAFNAQGSRVIVVVVQEGAVKLYLAAVEALRKDRIKLPLPPKIAGKTRPCPS